MKKVFYILFIVGLFGSSSLMAQHTFSIQYSMGFGANDVKSYVSSPSFRGADLQFRQMVQPNIGVGVDVGWNTFYERRAFATYTSGATSLSGVQYRYINAVPIYLAVDYQFNSGEKVRPFVGLGVGTLNTVRDTDMGVYTTRNSVWAFALRPEAGVLVEANPGLDVILVGKYNAGFSTSDQAAQQYFTLNVGFVFKQL